MKFSTALLAALALVSAPAFATNGTSATVNSSTTCANGACARSATRRGFYGRSISHQGTTTTP
jgi:hypothetical protein